MSGLTMQELARISNISYQPYSKTRTKFARDINRNLKYEHNLSNKHIAVVRDIRSDTLYVSHRGTKLSNRDLAGTLEDLWADAHIVQGKEKSHSRFKEAEQHYKGLREQFPKSNIIMSSHSLGGSISRHIVGNNSNDKKLEVHAFNPGSSIGHVLDKIKPKKKEKEKNKIHVYHSVTKRLGIPDFISLLGRYGADNLHLVEAQGANPHSLQNFTKYNGDEHNL
jgi:hypothetical protein